MKINFQHYYNELIKFLRSTDFSKAIVLTIAIVIPIAVFSNLGLLEIGVSMAMGSLLSSPSDVAGSFKHKVMGIMAAAFLGAISFCIAGYASQFSWAVAPMLLVMMFGIAYLSVYGFRASLVTFAGLLAVVLSFANISSEIEIWQKSILIFGGGFFYMLISIAWYLLKPERASEQQIAETMELTADYLRLRIRILDPESDLETIQKELFQKQTELNEHHESLRELLITFRMSSGSSGYTRKRLLIFIDLVDMLELELSVDDWKDTIDTNLNGLFYSVKASVEALKKTEGYIITISSLAGTNYFAGGAAYNASKFAVTGFSQAIMLDLRDKGVKVSTIMPGSVATHFNGNEPSEEDAWKIQSEDIGELVGDLLKMNPRTLPSKIEVRPARPPKK